jgi:hypothetical protein
VYVEGRRSSFCPPLYPSPLFHLVTKSLFHLFPTKYRALRKKAIKNYHMCKLYIGVSQRFLRSVHSCRQQCSDPDPDPYYIINDLKKFQPKNLNICYKKLGFTCLFFTTYFFSRCKNLQVGSGSGSGSVFRITERIRIRKKYSRIRNTCREKFH